MVDFTQYIPVLKTLAGGLTEAGGSLLTGYQQRKEASFEARQIMQNAGQVKAMSQRAAEEELRQAKLVESRILALAAASGGGASDPTIMRLIGKQAGEGAYRAAVQLYRGDAKAAELKTAADAKRYEGKSAYAAGMIKAVGSLAKTGGSLYERFSAGGPEAITPDEEPAADFSNWWGTGSFD